MSNDSKATMPDSATQSNIKDTTTPDRPAKRKPRKLNKPPASSVQTSSSAPTSTNSQTSATKGKPNKITASSGSDISPILLPPASHPNTSTKTAPVPPAAFAELEALKARVRGLEAKVEDLYNANKDLSRGTGARSPRRRGKGKRKGSQTTVTTAAEDEKEEKQPEKEDDFIDTLDDELVRLEDELEVARQDLATFRHPNSKASSRTHSHLGKSHQDDDVEEVMRDGEDVEDVGATVDRQVTLTGSYRIPLPNTVSVKDVKSIQEGISSAQKVASAFLEKHRAAAQSDTRPRSSPADASGTKMRDRPDSSDGNKSWSEWFGGYSLAISRAVKNIEAEAAVESRRVNSVSRNSVRESAVARAVADGEGGRRAVPGARKIEKGARARGGG